MNSNIKKFWQDAGYNVLKIGYLWRASRLKTDEWFIVFIDNRYYLKNEFLISNILGNNISMGYSEKEMLKLIKLKMFW
jgi:hypothetical protein